MCEMVSECITVVDDNELVYDEVDGVCQLVGSDKHCGHIFFNKQSLLLKYHCKFCLGTFDNINYFCAHLSKHIFDDENENIETINEIQTTAEPEEEYQMQLSDCESGEPSQPYEMTGESETDSYNSADFTHNDSCASREDIDNYNSEMLIEQLDEVVEDDAELHLSTVKTESQPANGNISQNNIRMSRLDIIRKPKHRKVTTVKVIAVRNRITELYERIKAEQAIKTKEFSNNNEQHVVDMGDVLEQSNKPHDMSTQQLKQFDALPLDINEPSDCEAAHTNAPPKLIQKIIGETVITLIPEGCKMPEYTAPSTLNEQQHKRMNADRQRLEHDDCTCPACGKRFRSSFSLTIHKRSHYLESNSNIKLAHKCSDCDRLFNKISELREHVEMVHFPEGFICKICNKQLTSLNLLEIHMRKVHLQRSFRCNHCGDTFENLAAYETHANIPNGCGYNYRCQICGRKYTTDRALQQHLSNHKERVPHTCVVCGKKTLRITQHMKIHAPRPKRINKCNFCGKCFNFNSGLSNHYRVMHRQQRMQQKLKKHTAKKSAIKTANNAAVDTDEMESKADLKVAASYYDNGNITRNEVSKEKRVVVEMIQAGDIYKAFDNDDGWSSEIECAPPMAREETITAVNSIVES